MKITAKSIIKKEIKIDEIQKKFDEENHKENDHFISVFTFSFKRY